MPWNDHKYLELLQTILLDHLLCELKAGQSAMFLIRKYAVDQCSTPDEWVEEAKKPEHLQTILLDHLLCELKAGQSAMFLIRK